MPPADDILVHARALSSAGRHAEALAALESAGDQLADNADAWFLVGSQHLALNRPKDAILAFERSIGLEPRSRTYADLAMALTRSGRQKDAAAAYGGALDLDSRFVPALNNRASLWLDLQRPELALADALRVIDIKPDLVPAYRIGCRALLVLHRPHEALVLIERAVDLAPHDPATLNNRGCALQALQHFDEALSDFEAAAQAQPNEPNHRYNRAFLKLRRHQYAEGWRDYETRWQASVSRTPTRTHILKTLPPLDLGVSADDLAGQKVLVFGEQGLGDEVMFASLLPDLQASAAEVNFVTHPRLQRLFAASFPGLPVMTGVKSLDLTSFDRVVPIGTLAGAYRQRREDFPGRPYLSAPPQIVQTWEQRMGPWSAGLRVGVAWRGGTDRTATSQRSLSLEALRPLLERSDCEFVSLQYGDVEAEVEAFNATLKRPIRAFPKAELDDLAALAGLVQAVDVVVSVQQTLVHLSGALGRPCLVLLPYHGEWRYGEAGETMPWYASVRLLRQPAPGDWAPVIAAAGAALDGAQARP